MQLSRDSHSRSDSQADSGTDRCDQPVVDDAACIDLHDEAESLRTPRWITAELIDATLRTWQPYYPQTLTREEAIGMLKHVGRLAELLRGCRSVR
jgi:hypothetical protein